MGTTTIKSTINLNKYYKAQLEYLVEMKEINSITEGINLAIEQYVNAKLKELYEMEMKKAKFDNEFIKRTMGSQKDFEKSDLDIEKSSSSEDCEW